MAGKYLGLGGWLRGTYHGVIDSVQDLPAVTEKALAGIDVRVWPYPVTQQMLIDAVMELEQAQP